MWKYFLSFSPEKYSLREADLYKPIANLNNIIFKFKYLNSI